MHNWNPCVVCLWQIFLFSPSPEKQLGLLLLRPDRMGKHLLWSWLCLLVTLCPSASYTRDGTSPCSSPCSQQVRWGFALGVNGMSLHEVSTVLKPWVAWCCQCRPTKRHAQSDWAKWYRKSNLFCHGDALRISVFDHSEGKYFRDAGNPKDNYCNTWVILGDNEVWTRPKFLCTHPWTNTRKVKLLIHLDTPIWDKKL